MQLNLKQNRCIALEGQNNRPICQDCLKIELEDWLERRKPSLLPSLKKKSKIFFNTSNFTNNIPCSICNKKINTCDFCFRQHIKKWIKSSYPRLLAEFRLFFDCKLL